MSQTNESLQEVQERKRREKAAADARMQETEDELYTALALCSLGRLLLFALRTDALE